MMVPGVKKFYDGNRVIFNEHLGRMVHGEIVGQGAWDSRLGEYQYCIRRDGDGHRVLRVESAIQLEPVDPFAVALDKIEKGVATVTQVQLDLLTALKALCVLAWDPEIAAWLRTNQPKAYEQALKALEPFTPKG